LYIVLTIEKTGFNIPRHNSRRTYLH